MPDTRLIERWLPIAALGIEEYTSESGRSMTAHSSAPITASTSGGHAGRWWLLGQRS